jgi:flagellar basal body rod protein FlgF
VDFQNTNELIVLDKTEYEKATKHYKLIKNSYIGCYKEMQSKIDILERRILELQNECNLIQEKHKNLVQEKEGMIDLIREKHNNLIKEKEGMIDHIREKHNNLIQEKEGMIDLIREKHKNLVQEKDNQLLLKDKEIELKDKEIELKEKEHLIALNETKHQNELLQMKTQMLELQLNQLMQVSKPKISKSK